MWSEQEKEDIDRAIALSLVEERERVIGEYMGITCYYKCSIICYKDVCFLFSLDPVTGNN